MILEHMLTVSKAEHFQLLYIKNLMIFEKSKIKIKNSMYNICGVVVSVIGSGIYNILISKDYPLYK